ncbi:endolytic transglycosylase MltG [Aerococcus sp. 1KP-2016]|jgi:UPF0755 protein|uniref:endolytic transglycosylase MltG n=1 Tax=Aerococcus sp. 1KP-2016 TaxID=1981982 RepID=UPI000B99CE85|nr:endolytic transglycosylase MltG [Aerococcus sp. 1KP-2016]OYQ67884.1 aminodeoxychorismate lyase [Aerococcus sp. 1KP-2016]
MSKKAREEFYEKQKQIDKKSNGTASKITMWVILVFIGLLVVTGLSLGFMAIQGGFGSSDETVEVEIPEGSTASDIAKILDDQGIIFNDYLFVTYLRLTGEDAIEAGTYTLNKNLGFQEASNQLQQGATIEVATLAIPEGSSLEDISQIIADTMGLEQADVLTQMTDESLFSDLLAQYPDLLTDVSENEDVRYKLEGYLYPATYELDSSATVADAVTMMVSEMENIRLQHTADIEASGLTFHEFLTLASLVEAEASTKEDREMIAGVFNNRLAIDMPIQSDISVLYANNTHSAYVTNEDAAVDSPYNLYINTGLGPGPFNNPGLEAIEASMNPTESNYLYFVADLTTGEVYYSETYEEHAALVEQYVTEANADL